MVKNPIIEEIHKIRRDYAERFANALHALCQDALQSDKGKRVIPANHKHA